MINNNLDSRMPPERRRVNQFLDILEGLEKGNIFVKGTSTLRGRIVNCSVGRVENRGPSRHTDGYIKFKIVVGNNETLRHAPKATYGQFGFFQEGNLRDIDVEELLQGFKLRKKRGANEEAYLQKRTFVVRETTKKNVKEAVPTQLNLKL